MKKLLSLLLALAMALSLAACGKKNDNQAEDDSPAPEVEDQTTDKDNQQPLLPDPEKDEEGSGDDIPEDNGEEAAPTVYVSHEDVTLSYAGDGFQLTVWNSEGKDPDACTYTSADPAVAVVDETGGGVTAVAPGTTTVTAHAVYGEEQMDFDCVVRCQWEDVQDEPEPSLPGSAASLPALTDFFTTLQGSYEGLDAMMVMEGEMLDNYYPGLSGIAAVEEVLVQETRMSISNIAVGLVKLSDEATQDDVTAVQNIFNARMTAQAEGGAFYPESCETWKNGVVTSVSNCVGMFVYPDDAQELANLFTEAFTY